MENYTRFESRFLFNNYEGYPENGEAFLYKKGSIPIIVSVPHAVRHMRDGKSKSPELYTGAIGSLLHEQTGVHLLAKCATDEEDPNYSLKSAYRDKLETIVKEHNIQLVIDLHGAKESHPFSIDVGTGNQKTLSRETFELFCSTVNQTENHSFIITENHTFFAKPNTVTQDLHKRTNIETMQLEINRKYRKPTEDLQSFVSLLQGLIRFIQERATK